MSVLTALWLQKHLDWEVMSVVRCTVAAETSGWEVMSVVHLMMIAN